MSAFKLLSVHELAGEITIMYRADTGQLWAKLFSIMNEIFEGAGIQAFIFIIY